MPVPAGATKLVQAAVVSGPCVGVGRDRRTCLQGALGQHRPGEA